MFSALNHSVYNVCTIIGLIQLVHDSVNEVYLQVNSNMTNTIQTIFFIKNILRTLTVLTQKNYLGEKKYPPTASLLLHLIDEKKKKGGKGFACH